MIGQRDMSILDTQCCVYFNLFRVFGDYFEILLLRHRIKMQLKIFIAG